MIDFSQLTSRFTAKVKQVRQTDLATYVQLSNRRSLRLSPFTYVHEGDTLDVGLQDGRLSLVRKQLQHGGTMTNSRWTIIVPPYCATESVFVPPHEFRITFRERLSVADWREAKHLEQFHYRGQGLNRIVGRRSVLLAVEERRGVIAYGVVSATVPLARPRFRLLGTYFREQMQTKLINQIARIPRIVVHPEYRGMGIGTLMARHLVRYVSSYWDINGYPPILLEVIAAMTEYHRFFESAGFVRIGDTEGYEGRKLRPQYGNGAFGARTNAPRYNFLQDQLAKPYLVYPLTREIEERVLTQANDMAEESILVPMSPLLHRPILLKKVSVAYKSGTRLTTRAGVVKEAFGVDASQMQGEVLRDFSIEIHPGDVVLLTGASGSGKSTAVRLVTTARQQLERILRISGRTVGFYGSRRSQVAQLSRQSRDTRPLIEQLGKSPAEAIHLLNSVGLSEAHLYLRRPSQISEGQKYRFAIAVLCDSKKPIWVADEFASTLDPETAAVVASGLRKIAYGYGATVVTAAAHCEAFVESLVPNTIVRLSWGMTVETWSVRMKVTAENDVAIVHVLNRSPRTIVQVQIGGIDERGAFAQILTIPSIAANSVSNEVRILLSTLEGFKAISVRSPNKVGDIVYLNRGRPRQFQPTVVWSSPKQPSILK